MNLSSEQRVALKQRLADECALIMLPNPEGWNDRIKTAEQKAEIKDRAQTLQAGIRLPYERKLILTERIIREALGLDSQNRPLERDFPTKGVNWAVSYSAGGDSTILSHFMVARMSLKTRHVGSNTRMEYPETVKQWREWAAFLESHGVEFSMVFPAVRPRELWKKIGVPLFSKQLAYKYRKFAASPDSLMSSAIPDEFKELFAKIRGAGMKITDQCCDELKKKPLKKWAKENGITGYFTGVRAGESMLRRMTWIRFGSLYESTYHGRMWIANPLAFWTQEDRERYLRENDIVCHQPQTIRGGSGCVTCMFGCHMAAQAGEENALQQLAKMNPRLHAEALDEWGYREVLDLLEIPYV